MNEQTTYTCNNCKKEMDETSFYYRLNSCDKCTNKARAYRLNVQGYRTEYEKNTCHDDSLLQKLKES